jgi:hypothetical protein
MPELINQSQIDMDKLLKTILNAYRIQLVISMSPYNFGDQRIGLSTLDSSFS